MPTSPSKAERGEGWKYTYPIYEGTFTRADVETTGGIVQKGGTYAAPIVNSSIDDGIAYVKEYTSFTEMAYQSIADNENGDQIKGRVISISKDIPEVSADGGTAAATLINARRATVEIFRKGQQVLLRVDGSGTTVDINDNLSLKASSKVLFVQDNSNGGFKALQTTTGADVWILAEVL